MDATFSKSAHLDSLLPRQSSVSSYQTIGVFLVSPSCSWKKLELNFKKSTYLTEFQPRFIKLNTTRSVFTSAKVYYCWSVPQKSPSQTTEETLNLVFICGESLSTCVLIHTSLKKEASWNKSDSEICDRLPTDFEIDCVIFYFDDASKELDDARMQRWLHRHLSNYPSPTRDSLFIGVVSVNQSKSDEQLRPPSEPTQQPNIDFYNVKCFYLHLYQLIRTLINFRLKTKLPLFHNQLTPVNSDCAINGQRRQSLHEYESLNVTASDNSAEYEKAALPIKLNGFTLGSSDEDSTSRTQLLSLSLSTQSAQTYFATMRTQASQTDIALPSGRSSDNDVFAKSENEYETPASQSRHLQKLSLSLEPQKSNLINQSFDFTEQHRTLSGNEELSKLRNLSVQGNYPWQMTSLDGADSGILKKSHLSLRFGRSCETLDSRDEKKRPPKFSSFKNVRKPNWSPKRAPRETQNNDPGVPSSNYSTQVDSTSEKESSSLCTSIITKDERPQKYLTSFEKQHLVPWQPSQETSKKVTPRPQPLCQSKETVAKNDLSQTQVTSNFSDIASKSTLSDNTLEFTAEKSSCESPRRKKSMEQFRQQSIDEDRIQKDATSMPPSKLVRPFPRYPEPRERALPANMGERWPTGYADNPGPEVGKISSLPKRQVRQHEPADTTETNEPEILQALGQMPITSQLCNSVPSPIEKKEEPRRGKTFFDFARSKSPIDLQKLFNGKDASKKSQRHSSLSRSPFQVVPFDEFQYLDNFQVAKMKERRHSEFPQSPITQSHREDKSPYMGNNNDDTEVGAFSKNEPKLESPISPKNCNKLNKIFSWKEDPGQASKYRSHSESRVSDNKKHPKQSSKKHAVHGKSKSSKSDDSEESQEEEEACKIGRERKNSKSPYAASQTTTCLDPAMSKQLVTPLLGVKSPKHCGEKRDHGEEEPKTKRRTSLTSKRPKNSQGTFRKKKTSTSSKR